MFTTSFAKCALLSWANCTQGYPEHFDWPTCPRYLQKWHRSERYTLSSPFRAKKESAWWHTRAIGCACKYQVLRGTWKKWRGEGQHVLWVSKSKRRYASLHHNSHSRSERMIGYIHSKHTYIFAPLGLESTTGWDDTMATKEEATIGGPNQRQH